MTILGMAEKKIYIKRDKRHSRSAIDTVMGNYFLYLEPKRSAIMGADLTSPQNTKNECPKMEIDKTIDRLAGESSAQL